MPSAPALARTLRPGALGAAPGSAAPGRHADRPARRARRGLRLGCLVLRRRAVLAVLTVLAVFHRGLRLLALGLAFALAFGLALGLGLVFLAAEQITFALLVGFEVRLVPARALEAEHRRRHQLLQRAFAAGRALTERCVADFLHYLGVVLAGLAFVFVERHEISAASCREGIITAVAGTARACSAAAAAPCVGLGKRQLAVLRGDADAVAGQELPLQDAGGERILDLLLYGALQRSSAVHRIEACLAQHVARRIVEGEIHVALGEALAQVQQLDVDDRAYLARAERVEHHDIVDAIDELRPEALLHNLHHRALHPGVILLAGEFLDHLRAEV